MTELSRPIPEQRVILTKLPRQATVFEALPREVDRPEDGTKKPGKRKPSRWDAYWDGKSPKEIKADKARLNKRERVIVDSSLAGEKDPQIADTLQTTADSVRTTRTRIIKKLTEPPKEKPPTKLEAYFDGMEPEVIIKELEILNPRLRQIAELALESSKGLKNAQLAEIMDTTEAAIFTAKSRIIKQLKAPRGEKVPSKWDAYWEGTSPEERAADLARVEARWPDTDRREIAEMLLGSDEEPPKTPNAIADIKDTTADNIRAKKSQILHLLSPRKA